jgi:hypothetical protein
MAMREMPFSVNVTQELEKIEIEKMRDALLGSLTAYTQAIPQLAAQGQDAAAVVRKIAEVIKARQQGIALEDAIETTFTPEQQVPSAGAPSSQVEQPSPAPSEVPAGGTPPGQPVNIRQAPPDVMSLISGITGGGSFGERVSTRRTR